MTTRHATTAGRVTPGNTAGPVSEMTSMPPEDHHDIGGNPQ